MTFVSSLTEEQYNKKPGDLIKSSDWNTLAGEVAALGSAKLDRDGGSIQGDLAVGGALSVAGAIAAAGAGQPLHLRSGGGLRVEDGSGQPSFSVSAGDGAATVRGALTVGGSEIVLVRSAGNIKRAARALVDGGAQDGLVLNYGNDFGRVTVAGDLVVQGQVRSAAANSSLMEHMMYLADPLIYQDIFDALNRGAIAMLGSPKVHPDWNTRHHTGNLWFGRTLIQFGSTEEADGNGAVVEIPAGYDTVWLRVLGERFSNVKAYFLDGAREECGIWAGGYRPHSICPDGAVPDSDGVVEQHRHQWLAIPVRRAGRLALVPKQGDAEFWLSGLAFSKNPWAHAAQSGRGYHAGFNGSEKVAWVGDCFAGDLAAAISNDSTLQVPVIPNGRDKLLYIVSASVLSKDNQQFGANVQHTAVSVNGQPVERFLSTYDNPFARYWGTRTGCGYMATRVSASLIPAGARYLKLQVDLSRQQHSGLRFREAGTYDFEAPVTY